MGVRGRRVAAVHALHSQAIERESIVGLLRDELFEHLAAGFLLVGHRVVPYYTGAGDRDQREVDGAKSKDGRKDFTQRSHSSRRRGKKREGNGEWNEACE